MIRAQNRTRTCTSLLTLVPETSASTIPPPGQEHESKKCYVSGKRDSNSRPQPWQGCALPTELFPQTMICFMHFKSDSYRIQTYNLLIRSQMLYSVELRSRTIKSDSYRIQTYNLLIRSQMLYSVELRSHTLLNLNNLTPERVTPIGFKPITF